MPENEILEIQRELNRLENTRLDAARVWMHKSADPESHAAVLLILKNGDQLAAWMLALRLLRYTPKSEPAQREYWFNVAEIIARTRPVSGEPSFLRGRQFVSARRSK